MIDTQSSNEERLFTSKQIRIYKSSLSREHAANSIEENRPDQLDQLADDSFPASDPPSYSSPTVSFGRKEESKS